MLLRMVHFPSYTTHSVIGGKFSLVSHLFFSLCLKSLMAPDLRPESLEIIQFC